MELTDALKILAAARHFDDLDLALRFVGCTRSEAIRDDVPPAPGLLQHEGDRSDLPEFDEILRHQPVDGWSLLTEIELDDVLREAENGPAGLSGRSRRRGSGRDQRGPGRPEPARGRYTVPVLLQPAGEEAVPTPAYHSVPMHWPSRRGPALAAHLAINPRTGAATMHALLKRQARSVEIDVEALVRRLSLAQPIKDTPRLERTTTVPPMHLLYDTSLLIGPFADDVQQLARLARALFGEEILEIRAFRKSLRGGCGRGPVWTWRPFRFPAQPATVVFISGSFGGDLDIRVRELEEIVGELERKGHHACVLWLGDPPRSAGPMQRSWRVIRT